MNSHRHHIPPHRWNRHLQQVGESYCEHGRHALGSAALLLTAAGACLVHALAPFVFESTASRLVARLHNRMITQRLGKATPDRHHVAASAARTPV